MFSLLTALLPTALLLASLTDSVAGGKAHPTPHQVFLRVEGSTSTIFEGVVFHPHPREVTTPSGGTHECNGENDGVNAAAGVTPTSALSQAANRPKGGFPFDGTFDDQFEDFFITSIGGVTETATQFWGLLVNFQFTATGGCQTEVAPNQHVLWAFDAFNAVHFLELVGPTGRQEAGVPFTLTVTDGSTGSPVAGATVGGETSDANGNVVITPEFEGPMSFKAEQDNSIRSNRVVVNVFAP